MKNDKKESIPTQAVILCGGLGTRLMPYTKETPKPMVLCNNIPFLWYILDHLSSQGVKNFCLLTGYLSSKINNYFTDGSKFGWNITYSEGPVDWMTGKRLWNAKEQLNNNFLLLYADNFSLVNLFDLCQVHKKNNTALTFSVFKRKSGNVKINNDHKVLKYKKLGKDDDLGHVEIGYMVIK